MFFLDDATRHVRDAGRPAVARSCLATMARHKRAKMTPPKWPNGCRKLMYSLAIFNRACTFPRPALPRRLVLTKALS